MFTVCPALFILGGALLRLFVVVSIALFIIIRADRYGAVCLWGFFVWFAWVLLAGVRGCVVVV